jgi:hypothetical protein
MVLTIVGIVSDLSVVIGVIIDVSQAPSFADAPVILFIVGPFGALLAPWPTAPAQPLGPQGDRRRSGVRSSRTDSPMSPLGGEPVLV